MSIDTCPFCQGQIAPDDIVGVWDYWQVIVNRNQNYLGKLMLVLRRHETDVTALSAPEQTEFWTLLGAIKESLMLTFKPDHFNYSFLMNADAHVHMHIIPRYAEAREFVGQQFVDGRLGDHYDLSQNVVSLEVRRAITETLRDNGLLSANRES